MRLFTLAVVLAAAPLLAATDEDAIRAAEKQWAAAVVAKDYAALDRIFADRLIYAHSTGAVQDKAEYVERLKSGKQRYDSITHESTKVVPYGNTAVAHSIVRMSGNNGQPFNDHVMMMHFWVKQGGSWKLAAHQTTKLPQ